MRKHLLIVTSAMLSINGFASSRASAQVQLPERQPGAGTTVDRAASPLSGAIADNGMREQNAVREVLSKAVTATFSEKMVGLGSAIAEADRERLGEKLVEPDAHGTELISQFRRTWRTKYNEEFDVRNGELAFNDANLRIVPGTSAIESVAQVASDRQGITGASATRPAVAVAVDKADTTAAPVRENLKDMDRSTSNSIIAVLPSSGHRPEVRIPLIRQSFSSDWKIDLPDGTDAVKLKANIQKHLAILLTDPQNWPADVKDGYRMASHRALEALVPSLSSNVLAPASVTK